MDVLAELQDMVDSENLGLHINIKKTKVMVFSKKSIKAQIKIKGVIDAFEMYLYRRMLRLSWIQKITNEEVLRRMDKRKELMNAMMQRKTLYFGHIMRGQRYSILRLLLEGTVEGKHSVGRRQNSWLKDQRRWFERTSLQIFRAAVSKTTLVMWIANLRRERANYEENGWLL